MAPNNPNRVYVVSGTQYGLDKGFYVSNDGGDSFAPAGRAGGNSGYEWWFGRLWVDPKDQNHVFNADVSLRESNDGGATWHTSSGVHADQHAMQWDPNGTHRVYVGNDGGIYRSESDGATRTWVHATYEPFNQSYHLAVAADDPDSARDRSAGQRQRPHLDGHRGPHPTCRSGTRTAAATAMTC